jgi:PAS domain S-box-containing protein
MSDKTGLNSEALVSHFAVLLQSVSLGVIGVTPDGVISVWNGTSERLFGYSADEIVGKPLSVLTPQHLADQERLVIEGLQHSDQIRDVETQRIHKDGHTIDVYLTYSAVRDHADTISGVFVIAANVAETKRMERAELDQLFLSAIVSSADDAIVSKDLNGVVTSWNKAAEKLFGYTSDEMIGQPIARLIPVDHPNEEPEILARIRRGERIAHYETQRVRKDGRMIDVSLTVSPIKDSLGRVIGASKIARDISEQKRAVVREREALREAQQARRHAEEASRTKDEFLATISHELRTPMTAIVGWSHLLLSGQLGPELQQKAFETIDRNARSQAQLIEDLLDISRIVSGKLRVDFKPVELQPVVLAAIEAVRPSAEAKRVRLQTRLEPEINPILGDAERLQQVVWNLLSNAIRFTPSGGWVKVELRRDEKEIELRVSDNGIGIRAEFLPNIFDRFTQADSSITRAQGGLGMGLAIVKSLVELHGGVVSAYSAGEGHGAVFTIRVPVTPARHDLAPGLPPSRTTAETALHCPELVGVKILVVDDEQDTCEMLRFIFNQAGAVVETADSAETALEAFDRWKPEILVSDIGLPHVDGYALIRNIRHQRHSAIPAVALTAMARIDDRIKALNAGYQMHVAKPVDPRELISIVAGLAGLVDRNS